MNNITQPRVNKKVKKLLWSDDEKMFLLKNSKIIPIQEIAEILKRDIESIRKQCFRIGCGYFSNTKCND